MASHMPLLLVDDLDIFQSDQDRQTDRLPYDIDDHAHKPYYMVTIQTIQREDTPIYTTK